MEYRVTVRSSEGEQAPITVHARSDIQARERAEQASKLEAVAAKRVA